MSRHGDRRGQIADFRDSFEMIDWLYLLFTPQPSGLEGYCRHGPGGRTGGRAGGRSGGRLPDLRNPYLCNRLMDFLRSKFYGIV